MNNEKKAPVLTLEHLAPYLPHEVELAFIVRDEVRYIDKITGISDIGDHDDIKIKLGYNDSEHIWMFKPILRPIYEYKDINSKSMNELNTDLQIQIEIWDLANKKISFHSLSYGTAIECFANHIDIFGLIDKGLAIDINSIEGKETKGNG